MADIHSIFAHKKITQVGLGLLGRGMGDAAFLAKQGADLMVTDLKNAEELAAPLEELKRYPNISYHLGEHRLADFQDRDLILKGAGVPHESVFIKEARSNGIPVDMSASLFARIAAIPFVGVTGTRGKSTVTHLINAILKADGRITLLGGNIRGVSNLALLEQVTPETMAVFELDSWQCQGLGEERSLEAPGVHQGPLSPSVAVFTTFMPDHLNYYKGDTNAYLADKANIFRHQGPSDTLVVGRQALPALAPYKKDIHAHVVTADESDVPGNWAIQLVGPHNRYNIGIAVATARALGVDDAVIQRAVEVFTPLPGRLQYLRVVRGIQVYNDTSSTTPEATAAALRALDPEGKKNLILIAGGADKGLDPTALIQAAKEHVKVLVLLKGTGTDKLLAADDTLLALTADKLEEAAQKACDLAEVGDIAVFSPAYASFGLFKNEYDRNDQFVHMVKSM
jgi:UDP-N-acetylmuramoylalanine--D-glutamate ligase